MRHIARYIFALTFLGVIACHAQDRVRVTFSIPENPIRVGQLVRLDIAIQNISGAPLGLDEITGDAITTSQIFGISVKDAKGTDVIHISQANSSEGGGFPAGIVVSLGTEHLSPGKVWNIAANLSEVFDFSQPGTYVVDGSFMDDKTRTRVKASPLTITVVPDPALAYAKPMATPQFVNANK